MKKIPADKRAHALGGAIVAALAYYLTGSPVAAMLAALIVGTVNEAIDWFGAGVADGWDILATVAGGAVVTVAWLLIA